MKLTRLKMQDPASNVLKTIFDKLTEENKARIGSADWKVIDQNMASLPTDVHENTLVWMIKLLKQQERNADTVPALLLRLEELPTVLKQYVYASFEKDTGCDLEYAQRATFLVLKTNSETRKALTKLIEECERPLCFLHKKM